MKFIKVCGIGALLLMPLGMGCGNSKPANPTGTGGSGFGGNVGTGGAGGAGAMGGAGGAGPIEFTGFVKDIIQNKTASNTQPETLDDKTFKDSADPAAFNSLFP